MQSIAGSLSSQPFPPPPHLLFVCFFLSYDFHSIGLGCFFFYSYNGFITAFFSLLLLDLCRCSVFFIQLCIHSVEKKKQGEKLQVEMLGLSEGVNDSKGSREGEGESVASEGDGGRRDSELPSAARRRCTFLVMTACSICSPLLLLLSPPSFPFSITGHLHLLIELFCH